MKTVADLNKMREAAIKKMTVGENNQKITRVVVGMATCGIAAGARPVLDAFADEVKKRGLSGVAVVQTGCIGMCQYEPIAEVSKPGEEKVTYVKMTADKVARIVDEHIIGGNAVAEYTVGAIAKQ